MDLVFDIETDDLQATLVHCIVAQDADSGEIFKFPPNKLEEGYKFLTTADRLIGHNIIGFDIPVLRVRDSFWLGGIKIWKLAWYVDKLKCLKTVGMFIL